MSAPCPLLFSHCGMRLCSRVYFFRIAKQKFHFWRLIVTPLTRLVKMAGATESAWTGARPLDVTCDTGVASTFVIQKSISVMRKKRPMSHPFPYEVNCSILLTDLPLLQRPQAAREAGFDAVEFWWPFAEAGAGRTRGRRVRRRRRRRRRAADRLELLAGDMPAGDRGLCRARPATPEFRDNIDVTVGIGERLGTKAFNALYGNRVDGAAPEKQDETRPPRIWRWPLRRPRGSVARCCRAGERRTGVSAEAPPPMPLAVIDRVRAEHDVESLHCSPTCTTSRSTATTSTRRSTRTRPASGTCRSPTHRGAANPAPGRFDIPG